MKKSRCDITLLAVGSIVFTLGILLFYPSRSLGSAAEFIPKIYHYDGELELDFYHDREVNDSSTGGSRTTDTSFQEKLRLSAYGYIYHPRFISFQGFVSEGLSQDRFEDSGQTSRTNDYANEYTVRVLILPRHPYTLELYAERMEPLIVRRSSLSYKPVIDERGVIFRYKKRRVYLSLRYIENITDYGTYTVRSTTQAASGSYLLGPFVTSAGYTSTDATTSSSLEKSTSEHSYVSSALGLKKATLSSSVDVNRNTQINYSFPSLTDDTFEWKNLLALTLPWNFRSSASYSFREETRTTVAADASPPVRATTGNTFAGVSLDWRLYNSLTARYSIDNISSDSSGGTMTTSSRAFQAGYIKMIPTGRFISGFFTRQSISDTKGALLFLNITFPSNVPGSFFLTGQNVDETSITVSVKRPDAPYDLIPLTKNTDYFVQPAGNTFRIIVNSLLGVGLLDGNHEFHVSYALLGQENELETDAYGYNIKFELFNNLINPYFGYTHTDQKLLSGTLVGGPQNSSTETVGILMIKAPFSLTEEYQSTVSTVNSQRSFRSYADYRKNLTQDMLLYARLQYTTTSVAGLNGYTDKIFGADARLTENLPRKHLSFAVGATYTHTSNFTTAETYSLNSSLAWQLGKLTVTAQASINESNSNSYLGKNTAISEQYLVTVTRRLF